MTPRSIQTQFANFKLKLQKFKKNWQHKKYIPASLGVNSTEKVHDLFSNTFGNICLPVGPAKFHILLLKYAKV